MQGLIGAIKIKDGLFLGDIYAAQDLGFIVTNKVTHIVNCAGLQVPNHWEPIGLSYLAFPWSDSPRQIILDSSMTNFSLFYTYIEQALNSGLSVLIHCVNRIGRSTLVALSYLMKRFRWNLHKTLQYLHYKGINVNIGSRFLSQAKEFENYLLETRQISKSNKWTSKAKDSEEEILRNTLINSLVTEVNTEFTNKHPSGKRISWAEPDKNPANPEFKTKNQLKLIKKLNLPAISTPINFHKRKIRSDNIKYKPNYCRASTYKSSLFR